MKTIDNFSKLPKNEQIYQIDHFGKLIGNRSLREYKISLYIIKNQFVEIWNNTKKERIDYILGVESNNIANLYPLKLKISEYLKV